jgi:hypothetical protein
MIAQVPINLVPSVWDHFSPMLEKSLEVHPFLSITDLFNIIIAGHADLIIDTEGSQAMVMEVVRYPSVRVANVVAMGGKKVMGQPLHNLIDFGETWAKRHDCDYFAMIGRPGWINFVTSRNGHSLKQIQAWKKLEPQCLAAV